MKIQINKKEPQRNHCIMLRLKDVEFEKISFEATELGFPLAVYVRKKW